MKNDRTLIVVPTYNERENVTALIPKLLEVVPNADVMLVDDSSPDGTAKQVEQMFAAAPRVSVLSRIGPRSYGHSLLDGYRVALDRAYTRVVQLDADFSHDPGMVPAMIAASRDAEVVIGSRYCPGGRVANWPWQRRLLSRFANRYVALITGLDVRDSTSGFRCYTRRALECFLDKGMGPALDCLDLIARAVTPPGRPRRFNARFFMARAEDATGEIRHSSELGDIRWVKLDEARELPLPTITGLILGEIGRLVKEPPDRKKQRKIPLFVTVHRKHLMIEE